MQSNQTMMPPQPSKRAFAESKYKVARMNLLLVTVFTLLNIMLAATSADIYLLFTAEIPYFITAVGLGVMNETGITTVFVILLVTAIVLTIPYLIFWIFSKKHYGWMIAALVYFSLDCAMLLYFAILSFDLGSMILDIVFHIWVLYYLIMGTKYGAQLHNLPEEKVPEAWPPLGSAGGTADGAEAGNPDFQNSPVLRAAENVRQKIHAEADAFGHHIVYRKAKKRDELVVDGMVYGEYVYPSWTAQPHTLTAYVKGIKISAGFAASKNFIRVNDMEFAKSTRWM